MKTIKLKAPKLPFNSATIEYDNGMESFNLANLTLHLEPEQEAGYLKGTILAERLKEKSCNASVLDYLVEHPNLYPEEWRSKYVYFWGTIFRDSDGSLCVRCGYWYEGEVVSSYVFLDNNWDRNDPSASVASPLSLKSSTSKSLDPSSSELESAIELVKNEGYLNL